jgi:hypothetical protein
MEIRATMALVCLLTGCGGDMPSDRYFRPYQQIGAEQLNNSAMCTSGACSNLVSNTLAVYEGSRRAQQTQIYNFPTLYDAHFTAMYIPADEAATDLQPGKRARVVVLDGRDILSGATGNVRLWLYYSASSATAVRVHLTVGRNTGSATETPTAAAGHWFPVMVQVAAFPAGEEIPVIVEVEAIGTANRFIVASIGIHEIGNIYDSTSFVDLSASLVGDPDYPCSSYVMDTLNNNDDVMRASRNGRTLISQNFYNSICAPGADYLDPTDYRGIGAWSLVKNIGPTTLAAKVKYYLGGISTNVKMTLTARLYPFWVLDHDGQTANFTTGDWLHGVTSHARAKIVHQVDHGNNGHLYLSHLSGTFANDENIVTIAGGAAVANGTADAPAIAEYIDAVDTTITWAANEWEWQDVTFSNNIIAGEAEYELRLDSKIAASSPISFQVANVFLTEPLTIIAETPEVDFILPTIHDCEINDDVRASTLKRIRTTQEQIEKRGRKILVNDFRQTDNKASSADFEMLAHGVVFPSYGATHIVMRAVIRRPNLESRVALTYATGGGLGGFVVGEKVTYQLKTAGGTWATVATGEVAHEDTVGGTLYLKNINGVFGMSASTADAKVIGAAGAVAGPTDWQRTINPTDVKVLLKLSLLADQTALAYSSTAIVSEVLDVTNLGAADQEVTVKFRVPIPDTYRNTYASAGTMPGPLVFVLMGKNTVSGVVNNYDYAELIKSYVYEEPRAVLTDY